jgi:MFS transporter, DHA1 family, tetracycline resistance protein
MQHSNNRQLTIIVLTVFLDLLGLSLVIPVAAPLFLGADTTLFATSVPLQYRTLILGFLLGTGPVVQFFLAPLLGAYADRSGRKPVLILSVLGNALGHALFGVGILTQHLWLLFISRALAGLGSANISAANSAVADISDRESKVRNFGLVGMALGLGFIFGPYLGGVLSDPAVVSWFNLATPLWAATVVSVLNAVVIWLFFGETLRERILTRMDAWTGVRNIRRAFSMPRMRAIYLVSFFMGFGYNFFAQFFSVFLVARFEFSTAQIGALFAYVGIWMAFTQGVLARYLSRVVPARVVVRWAPLAAVLVLLILARVTQVQTVYLLLPLVAMAVGVNGPNVTSLISDLADRESQGEALGIDRAMSALSFGLPPILSGWAVGINVSMPMVFAAFFIFVAWVMFVRYVPRSPAQVFHEVS